MTEKIQRWVKNTIESAQYTIAKFQENLAVNPAYAFEWSDGAFRAAADIKIAHFVQGFLDAEVPEGTTDEARVEHLRKYATRQVMNGARSPKRSTSPCTNLLEQDELAAWANLLERMERLS